MMGGVPLTGGADHLQAAAGAITATIATGPVATSLTEKVDHTAQCFPSASFPLEGQGPPWICKDRQRLPQATFPNQAFQHFRSVSPTTLYFKMRRSTGAVGKSAVISLVASNHTWFKTKIVAFTCS